MKTRKKIKIAILSLLGTVLVLFVVLVAHIAMSRPLKLDVPNIQVSRIDFSEPLDAAKKKDVCQNLRSIKGITSDSIIVKNNVVVYFHDNRFTDSQKVFNQLMAKGHYDAKMFTVPRELASKQVCPAMDPKSFKYKFALAVQSVFN
ncbi:MAG: hypothetical protein CFE23_04790 [Flavobacterium sp. BFFFF1]|uniref:hypothetical protein n=1 Tax=unclassified Flavobacterium TaxID=196869 RepID=UPI000BDB0F17|nr:MULTISPECIES: hypothetical protein [unclassified Flavobacterium]OYU81406.1 MAG: hypothetical protein CFE23_04790 [Flavobacterium sp. BFFFF1]